MTPWSWYAGFPNDTYDIAVDEPSREAVIAAAIREVGPGETIQILDARASEAAKHEGSDCVPFLRTRNHKILTLSPTEGSEPLTVKAGGFR